MHKNRRVDFDPKDLKKPAPAVELKAILFCPPEFYQLDGTKFDLSSTFDQKIEINRPITVPVNRNFHDHYYNISWTYQTPPLLDAESSQTRHLSHAEKEKIAALTSSLQYQFNNGLILTARELLKHPYGALVSDPLRPVLNRTYSRAALEEYAPFGTASNFRIPRVSGVKELEVTILSVLINASQQRGDKKAEIYLVNSPNPDQERSGLLLKSISTAPKSFGHWELQPSAELDDSEGAALLVFSLPRPNLPEQTYYLSGYELNINRGTLQFHTVDQSIDFVNKTVASNLNNTTIPNRLCIPLRSHSTILKIVNSIDEGLAYSKLPRIQRNSPEFVPPSKVKIELHLNQNGDMQLLRKVQLKDSLLELWNFPQGAIPLFTAFSQGLIGYTDMKAAGIANDRRGQRRERDMKVLKHVGIFSAILLETTSFLLFKKTSEGLDVPGKKEFIKILFERLGVLLSSLDPLAGLTDDPYDDQPWNRHQSKTTKASPPSLEKLCSKNVTSFVEHFVSEMESMLETSSEVLFTRQGEVHVFDSFRLIFEFFHTLLFQAAIESQGKCFFKSRTSIFAGFSNHEVQLRWPGSRPAKAQIYHLVGPWMPANRILRCLLPLRARGIDIMQDGCSFVEMNAADFRPEFTIEDQKPSLGQKAVQSNAPELVSQLDWFELHPKFFFKGEEIPINRLDRLANEGVIEFQGKLYLVPEKNLPSIKKLEYFWSKIRSGTHGKSNDPKAQRFYLLQKSQTLEMLALRASGVSVTGGKRWQDICHFYDTLDQRDLPFVPPPTVHAELKSYQKSGVRWMLDLLHLGLGGILADDMGLGKTLQALTFLEVLRLENKMGHVLIVVPTSLTFNWLQENEKFTPSLPMEVFQSQKKSKLKELLRSNKQMAIISTYGLFLEHQEVFEEIPWKAILFDEAQNLKNISAKRSSAARKIKAEIKFCLTGTPLENHLGEFFSLIDLVVPGSVGPYQEFSKKFVSPDTLDREQVQFLKLKVRPLIMRRTKNAILSELPPKNETTIKLPFEKKQEKIYRDIAISCNEKVKSAILTNGESRSQLLMLTALLRLRQACSDPASIPHISYPKDPPKMVTLMEALEEVVESGESALVFTQFLASFERVRGMLEAKGLLHFSIHGGTSRAQRESVLRKFQDATSGAVLLMTLKTGGVGLNLTKASYVFHLEPWWNPAVENQATDRVHRMGQEKHVQVYRYIMAQSVEEKIEILKSRKAARFNALFSDTEELGPGEKGSGQLTRDDFEYLLS
ncbi:MAG: DEAD/DEAH box helicase [Bdellovibrionia bacterium]